VVELWVIKINVMGSRVEQLRKEIRPEDPFYSHPLNQEMAKNIIEKRKRGKRSPKVENAAARRKAQDEFMQRLPEFQFNRALGHILDGQESIEDIIYVAENIKLYEQVIGRFRISSNGSGEKRVRRTVTVSIVDFTREGRL